MFEWESVCMYAMGMNRGWLGKNSVVDWQSGWCCATYDKNENYVDMEIIENLCIKQNKTKQVKRSFLVDETSEQIENRQIMIPIKQKWQFDIFYVCTFIIVFVYVYVRVCFDYLGKYLLNV